MKKAIGEEEEKGDGEREMRGLRSRGCKVKTETTPEIAPLARCHEAGKEADEEEEVEGGSGGRSGGERGEDAVIAKCCPFVRVGSGSY